MKKSILLVACWAITLVTFAQVRALHFDGTDDYVPITGTSKLNGLSKLTLETWVYVKTFSAPCANCAPIIFNQGGTAYSLGTGNSQKIYFSLNSGGSGIVTLTSASTISTNAWHHIAATYDGSKLRLFTDGVLTDSLSSSFTVTYSGTSDVWIADPVTGYQGVLEETRIWDYARNIGQIKEGMLKRYNASTSGLVLQLSYDDGVPFKDNTALTKVKDYSGQGNSCKLGNFTLKDSTSNFVLGRNYCDTVIYSSYSVSKCVKYVMPSKKRTVTKSGTYKDTISSFKGCDSIMTIKVTILNPSYASRTLSGCDSVVNPIYSTIYYKKTGKYTTTIRNAAGCDSVITINVTVFKKDTTIYTYDACDFVVLKNGKTVTNSDTIIDLLKGYRGCDSFIIHQAIIRHKTFFKRNLSFCKFVVCPSNSKKVFRSAGVYFDTLQNAKLCDSIIEYTVKSLISFATFSVTTCGSYQLPSKKRTYTVSGTYKDTLALGNVAGCDSFMTINLTITKPNTQTIQVTQCRSYTTPSGKQKIISTQQVTDILKNKKGCDSIVYTIDVVINNANAAVSRSVNTLVAATTNSLATFQWMDCSSGYKPIVGETNQSFIPSKDGVYALEEKENNCIDTSGCIVFAINSVNLFDVNQLTIIPNPSKGAFDVLSGLTLHGVSVELIDIRGQLVKAWKFDEFNRFGFEVNICAGLYYLKIKSTEGQKILPLLIE